MGLPEYMAETEWSLAYWEHLAKYGRRKRFWRSGWDHWALALSSDELNRRTLVIGPFVVALWSCRCTYCKADERHLLDILDAPPPEPDDIVAHVNQTVRDIDTEPWKDPTHYTTTGWHLASQCAAYPECPHHEAEGEAVMVDPTFYTNGRICYSADLPDSSDGDYADRQASVRVPTDAADATVISSELYGSDEHMPVLDIDVPIRVYPSSTIGHFHLYIDKPMSWLRYKRLMRALVRAGLVEKGYYQASKNRGGTHVRLPWIAKGGDDG